ncbi:MAG: linear amide C-N hydrolase [Clostridia bacterium]|nr:linear amide C-N hydrolase [Clostridia bacterium]
MKKWLKRMGLGLGALIVLVVVAGIVLFFNEIKTLSSLKKVDSYPFYTMTYSGDYGFDDFLKVGAKTDKDIEKFVTKRLLKGLPINLNITDAGCTAFRAKNSAGDTVFGRNFDFDFAPSLLLKTKPKNGYASISMVNLAFAGYTAENLPKPLGLNSFLTLAAPYLAFDGINEKGVTMALLAVPYAQPPKDPGKITLNTTTAIRLVLDKAASVDEAVQLLKQYNYYFSGKVECHYLIADATGKSVVVEFMDNALQIIEPKKDYQIASNFILYKDMNVGEGYTEFDRYNGVDAKLSETNGVISEKEAMALLAKVQIPDRTQWSVVYNLTSKEADICINKHYERVYHYTLK